VALSTQQAFDRFLLRVVDVGLAGVIFCVPLLMGGRHAIGQLALTVLVVMAALAWIVRQCLRGDAAWRPAVATPLILAGLGLVVLQTVSLSPELLTWLAPRTADILPLWNVGDGGPAALGGWSFISFTPAETRAGLVLFLDFALLFLVAVQRIRHIEDVERLLRWCALSAVLMASFGIVQLLAGNGKFFWFYEYPLTDASTVAKGSFTNRNHFAQFLALGIGPLIWWLQDAMRRMHAHGGTVTPSTSHRIRREELKTYLLGLALGIVLFAGLLSLSRGGAIAMLLAAAICVAVCYRAASVGVRFIAALAVAGALIGGALAIFGFERVSNRLEDISSGSVERLDRKAGRRNIWTATATAIPDFALLGTGVGSFREVYPMYTDLLADERIEFTHAENSYLQDALETGMIGSVLTFVGVALCVTWCIGGIWPSRPIRLRVCAAAIAGSLAASMAHALVDFVWYVPSCMAMAVIFAACALRVRQLSKEQGSGEREKKRGGLAIQSASRILPRPAWMGAAVILAVIGGWMIANRVGPAVAQTYWDEYQIALRAAGAVENPSSVDARTQKHWLVGLENVVQWQPTHLRAHLALAETHRRLFDKLQATSENPMSLTNIRDAAVQSRFPSREAMVDWLARATGKHWVHLDHALGHTRKALSLCPLEGRAYVYLAELSFLVGADADAQHACIEQAMHVRPFDGAVLYAAGTEALLAGDVTRWLDYSKRAFQSGPRQQRQILGDLVAGTPTQNMPAVIEFILREFRPDLEGARFLHGACANRCAPEHLSLLMRYRAQKAEAKAPTMENTEAARNWFEAQQLYSQLGDGAEALRCIRNALRCDPGNYNVRYHLGLCLMDQELFAAAETHLRWCLQRKPNSQVVENKLRETLKKQLDAPRRAAAEGQRLW